MPLKGRRHGEPVQLCHRNCMSSLLFNVLVRVGGRRRMRKKKEEEGCNRHKEDATQTNSRTTPKYVELWDFDLSQTHMLWGMSS